MTLTNKNIAETVKKVENFFESANVSHKDKIKICLLIEESLLRFQEKFGEDTEFKFVTHKWFGNPKVLIKVKDKPYNPIEDNEEQIFSQNIMQNLLNYEGAGIVYRYENGCNEVSAFSNKERKPIKIPGGSNTIAILLAIFFALIIQEFFSPTAQTFIADKLVTPILNKLFGAIIAVNIPLIFISIVASICAIQNVSVLQDLSIKVFKKFLWVLIFATTSAVFISSIFFPVINFKLDDEISAQDYIEMQEIFDLILSIIPQNIISPFLEEKVLQIVILAFLIGICVTILGERVPVIKNFILELQKIIIKLVSIVFKIIPAIIFLCILKIMLQNSVSEILNVWKIVAAHYSIYLFMISVVLLKNYFLYDIKILDFLKKIYPACLITFTTSSGSASMPKNIEICKNELKISKTLCDFYIPLSHPMCPSMKTASFIIWTFFAAQFSGAEITISQIFIMIFFSIQFAISSSNGGNGGMLAMMTLLLTQMNFSVDAIGVIMIGSIFLTQISGVIELIIRDCNLIDFSHKTKF